MLIGDDASRAAAGTATAKATATTCCYDEENEYYAHRQIRRKGASAHIGTDTDA